MTYIEIINNILRRLRERTVSTATESDYARLIGIFVNDAKTEIEDMWQWSALRNTLTLTTSNGVFNYELNGTRNRFTVLDVVNDTGNWFLSYKTAHEFNNLFLNQDPPTGQPRYYSFNGISDDGDTLVDLYPIPDNTYAIRFNVVSRTVDLSADDDKLLIPSLPVIQLAYAKAVEERGEDGGASAAMAFSMAQRSISDAIAMDAAKHPEETIWYTV